MKPINLLAAAVLAAAVTTPAAALVLQGTTTSGATVVNDFSGVGQIAFDVDFRNAAAVTLDFMVEDADLAQPIAFDAVLRNFTGVGFDVLSVALFGASFDAVGSVTRQFGGTTVVEAGASWANLLFTPPEFLDVELGDVFGTPGRVDWTLASAGLDAGDVFTVRVAPARAPEPAAWSLALLPLAALAWSRRRR